METKSRKLISAEDYARLNNVCIKTVYNWLAQNLIKGAKTVPVSKKANKMIWRIPANAKAPKLPIGRASGKKKS